MRTSPKRSPCRFDLDSYLSGHELVPQCVKIDAEAAEIRILKGAMNLLSRNAEIIGELHPYAWPEFGSGLPELKDLTAAASRRLRYLDQDTEIGKTAPLLHGIVRTPTLIWPEGERCRISHVPEASCSHYRGSEPRRS